MSKISYISGEFLDKTRESGFLIFFLAEHKGLLKKNLLIAAAITLIFILTDYIDFGSGEIFYIAFILRIMLASICLLALFLSRKIKKPGNLQNLLFIFTFIYISISTVLFYLVPYAGYSYVITGILIVLAICLFLPQRFSLGFISSILTSFFFLIPIILSDPPNEKLVFEGSTYLLAANIFGLITFRELNKYKRRNYLMLLENQNRHEQLRVRHDIMQKDLDLARNVQHKLISKSLPQRNIFTMYHPVEKVGGDLIDVLPITDNITGIFLADVSGHGVSAALVTVLIKAFLNRKLEEFTKDGGASDLFSPSRMLKSLNKNLSPYLGNHFVSAFYATYNHTERRLVYSGAAHPPPMLLVQGETGKPELTFLQMKKQFFPIGYFFQKSLCVKGECEFQINLSPGSRLIFYSDGLFDAINYTYDKSDEGLNSFRGKFIYKNLEEIFNIVPAKWMENFSVDLMEQRENFVEYDDISVVLANIV